MTTTRQQKVVTWQAPSGETINVCPACHEAGRDNIKTSRGEDYCSVSYGLHYGLCDCCRASEQRYVLIPKSQTERGPYGRTEIRGEVDSLAGGKDWGWRPTAIGAEAVCAGEVIAEAVEVH